MWKNGDAYALKVRKENEDNNEKTLFPGAYTSPIKTYIYIQQHIFDMWSFYVFPTVFYFLWQHMYLTDIIFVTLNVYCVVCSLLRFFSASSLLRSLSYHFVRCDSYHSFICQLKHRSEVIVHSVCLSVCLIILKFVHNISKWSYFTYKSFAFYSNGMCLFFLLSASPSPLFFVFILCSFYCWLLLLHAFFSFFGCFCCGTTHTIQDKSEPKWQGKKMILLQMYLYE